MTVIISASDSEELLDIADRIYVFYEGRISDMLAGPSKTPERSSRHDGHERQEGGAGRMSKFSDNYQRFRRQPAFTGLVLFLCVLVLNIVIQGVSTCITGGFTIGNFLAFFSPTSLNTMVMTNMPFILGTIGQAILLIVGQMDISIGVQIALVNVICIMVPQELGLPIWVGWTIAVAAAIVISLIADSPAPFCGCPHCSPATR
jgi:energy-coupling factor transporter ATP-binding protein EcfA2